MKCTNKDCTADLDEKDVQLTLKVLLCRKCTKEIQALRARLRSELEVALATLDDTLRMALLNGVSIPTGVTPLETVAEVQKQCRSIEKTTISSKSTKLGAITAGGNESSSKLLAQS